MAVPTLVWLELMQQEYLDEFIVGGGAAIKFVVGDSDDIVTVNDRITKAAARDGLLQVSIDAAATKLHMIQDVFFAVARSIDWDATAQKYIEALFNKQGYEWPRPGEATPIHTVADGNRVDVTLLRREVRQWLTADIMRDSRMAQDFRIAMTRLCLRRLEPDDSHVGVIAPVLEWLRGELRTVGALKEYQITGKITRHNGRAMLRSLCRWMRLCGRRGACVIIDIRQLARTGSAIGDGLKYSPSAIMDAFEVLRQLIDDAEVFEGLFVIVMADDNFVNGDTKRSIDAYTALKMRIWPDVHALHRDNPLAPLVRVGETTGPSRQVLDTGGVAEADQ